MEKLKYLFIFLLPVAVFATSISGLGTGTLSVDQDLYAVFSWNGYGGTDIEGTASDPANFNYSTHTGYPVILFTESSAGNYIACANSASLQDCLDNGYGVIAGSPDGYTVNGTEWEEVDTGGGNGTTTAITILSDFYKILLIALLVPMVIIYFYWWLVSTSKKI